MALLSYFHPRKLERDNNGELGILLNLATGFKFYALGLHLDTLLANDTFTSFSCQIDIGSCTFSKEFRASGDATKGYWYACKKINGNLKRVYFGNKALTLEALHATLDKFNVAIAPVGKPIIELAGNGKSDRHLQASFITESESLAMAITEIKELKAQNEILVDRIVSSTERNQQLWQKASKLEDAIAMNEVSERANKKIESLKEDVEGWQESCELLEKIIATQEIQIASLKLCNADLEKKLDYEENLSIDNGSMCQSQADFNSDLQEIILGKQLTIDALENEVKQLHKTVTQLEHKASKDEEFLLGYKYCAEQDHDALYKLECEHQAMQYCIDQYRALASGKTRQAHPRFNKLLDFIADIDKLS